MLGSTIEECEQYFKAVGWRKVGKLGSTIEECELD